MSNEQTAAQQSLAPIDPKRLWRRVEDLSRFTVPELPWTRRAFSDLFLESRAWLASEFAAAGLTVSLDAAGNLRGRREGRVATAKPIITGSHCDTVMSGGRFDGIIGVLAGIEVAHTLAEQEVQLDHPFEVIDFLSEEPSDYGVSCVGSRGYVGALDQVMLAETNHAGESLEQGIRRIGGDPYGLPASRQVADTVAAFVELHIEQGPVLEIEQLPIGVVKNIVGIRRYRVVLEGQPDHAGTTPMTVRSDALVAAARIIDAVSSKALAMQAGPHYVVATVGHLVLTPNASNAVPGRVEMMLEVRSDSDDVLQTFCEPWLETLRPHIDALRVRLSWTEVSRSDPTNCSESVMVQIEEASRLLGHPYKRMPSGAGHDTAYLAKAGPAGMIFIPCLKGRSHCPEEWITTDQLRVGCQVLYQTILKLDRVMKADL